MTVQPNAVDLVKDSSEKFKGKIFDHKDILQEILDKVEPVSFREIAKELNDKFDEKDKLLQKHEIVISILELLKLVNKENYGLTKKHDFIFTYNGAYWKEVDKEIVKDFLAKVAKKQGMNKLEIETYKFKNELFLQFLASANFQNVETDTNQVLINFKNGTLEISKGNFIFRDFQASDFLTYQLPFDYDKFAKCSQFNKFVEKVLPDNDLQKVLAEFIGYVFTKNLKLEKALFLYGFGANGKSVFFDIINAILGKENISNFSLCHLLEEHNRALIAHKLLNYGSEINASKTKDEFKQLVSNEPIQARLKYGQSFLMENYAKMAFNCNELPRDIGVEHAYFRRLLIIPFEVTIPENEQDKRLAQKIIQSELSGVFNWVLQGLKRIIENENFTKSKKIIEAVETYKRESDSVVMFLDETSYQPSNNLSKPLKELYAEYKSHCLDEGSISLKKNNFSKRLRQQNYKIDKGTGNQTIVWIETKRNED